MTVYGTKTAKLIVEPIEHKCPNCGTIHTMDMYVLQKYTSILGVPFFPTQKTGVAYCTRCSQTLRRSKMPDNVLKTFYKVQSHAHIPLWTWAGTALVIVSFLVLGIWMR